MEQDTNSNDSYLIRKKIVDLDIVIHRIKAVEQNLTRRADSLKSITSELLASGDTTRAKNYALEIAHIKFLLKRILYTEMLLEVAKTRLEIISIVQPIAEQIKVVNSLIMEAKSIAKFTSPELSELNEIDKKLEGLVLPVNETISSETVQDEEIKNILRMASESASRKIQEMYPEVPVEQKSLKDKLYEYAKSKGGRFVMEDAIRELKASRDEIVAALKELQKDGRIILEESEGY
ncbi:MAG: hypothetical protein ACP5KW_01800 [Thermoproteota archaeon]|jgi:division protein CdvB (Snf7/Vps24/ESCRT-III family)